MNDLKNMPIRMKVFGRYMLIFATPHSPLVVPCEFLDHYPLDKVPMPKTYATPGTEHQ